MSAPATEDLRELERLLLVAAETDETRGVEGLCEELGIVPSVMAGLLDELREHGKAIEAAPGEWRGPMQDELDEVDVEPEPPRVVVSSMEAVSGGVEAQEVAPWRRSAVDSVPPHVRLTMGIAHALDPAA
jgi:hypothetical protein